MQNEQIHIKRLRTATIQALIFGPLLFCSLYALTHWNAIRMLCEGSGDYALALLEIEKAARFEAFTGPYSRFHVRHPAPSSFYLLAALTNGFALSGSERGIASLAQLLVNAALLCVATAALVRPRGLMLQGVATLYLFIFLFLALRPDGLHDIWGPSQVVIPVFCFLCCAPLILRGYFAWSFWFFASAVLALSSHMGTAAIVGPVLLLCAFGLIKARNFHRSTSRIAKLSLVTGTLCALTALIPPLIDAFRNNGGNLLQLLSFLVGSPSSERAAGLVQALTFLGSFISSPFGLPDWLGTLMLLGLASVTLWRHVLRVSDIRVEALVVLTGLVGAIVGAISIRGPMYQYLMFPMCAVVTLLILLCAKSLCATRLCAKRLCAKSLVTPQNPSALPVLIYYTFLSAACLGGSIVFTARWKAAQTESCPDSLEPFISHFAISKKELIELRSLGADSWQALASSVYRLYRDGYTVCVPSRWGFLVGDALTCPPLLHEGIPSRRFVVIDTDKRPHLASPESIQVGDVAWRPEEKAM